MRSALNAISAPRARRDDRDCMDTDVLAGLAAGMDAILVLSGVIARFETSASRSARRDSLADLVAEPGSGFEPLPSAFGRHTPRSVPTGDSVRRWA
jgi:hypothetical protein